MCCTAILPCKMTLNIMYYALSVKVPFYKSSIPFRLLNRDKFSFRPHVFFGVVKVVFRKKYFETNKTES